jgi:hypothetical protein
MPRESTSSHHKLIRSSPNYRTTTTTHPPPTNPHPSTKFTSFRPQKCPKEDQDATTTTAPNATVVVADGSIHPSVIVRHTPTSVQSTTCLTRHTRLAVCVMVRTMLLREHGEINRLVILILPLSVAKAMVKAMVKAKRESKARKVKAKREVTAKRRSNQPRLLLAFLWKHNCLSCCSNPPQIAKTSHTGNRVPSSQRKHGCHGTWPILPWLSTQHVSRIFGVC